MDVFKKRFSPRVFSADPVPQEDIEIIFEAARLTPSARNLQPWHFYKVLKGSPEHDELFKCIPDRNIWAKTAPVIIVACYDPTEPNDGKNRWAIYDLGASVMSMIIQATDLGYYCRQIGSFDWGKVKSKFSIPDPLVPFTLITIGKIGTEKDFLNAGKEIIEKELSSNTKKVGILDNLNLKKA